MTQIAFDVSIDTSGLTCPLPILRAKKALSTMHSGQVLQVIATDPNSKRDFQAFCKQTQNPLVQQDELGSQWIHYIQRR